MALYLVTRKLELKTETELKIWKNSQHDHVDKKNIQNKIPSV